MTAPKPYDGWPKERSVHRSIFKPETERKAQVMKSTLLEKRRIPINMNTTGRGLVLLLTLFNLVVIGALHAAPCTLNCPNLTVCNDPFECGATVNYTNITTSLGCSVVCDPLSGSFFEIGTSNVICSARDTAGNTTNCSFIVTVNDCEPPTITCPN